MSTVYLGRDNEVRWQLQVDGVVVPNNSITSAELFIPAEALSDGVGVTYTTPSSQISLENNNTEVVLFLGHEEKILPGRFKCRLTLFDGDDTEGLAWIERVITFLDWRH